MLKNWKSLPPFSLGQKLAIGAAAALVIVLLLVWTFSDTTAPVEDDNAYKVLQGENNALRERNNGLRTERDAFKGQAQAMELERDGLRADLERYGAQAAEGVQKQKMAAEQYEQNLDIIGVDIPARERCDRYCANRFRLGYPCTPSPAAYCDTRYGKRGQ